MLQILQHELTIIAKNKKAKVFSKQTQANKFMMIKIIQIQTQ